MAIDVVLAELRPNVLIVDIEGAEVEVLADCDLSTVELIIIEMHPHVVGPEPIERLRARFLKEGFAAIRELESHNTEVFSRGRTPRAGSQA